LFLRQSPRLCGFSRRFATITFLPRDSGGPITGTYRPDFAASPIKQGATPVTETADIVAVLEPIMGMALTAREPEPVDMMRKPRNIGVSLRLWFSVALADA
jgi:hypothetical protein